MSVAHIHDLEKKVGYQFKNFDLITMAMTHSSYANEHKIDKIYNNERIEFLGDAVLEIVTSKFLYTTYPKHHEGDLTKMRASIVCEQTLALSAEEIGLGEYLLLGKGEEKTGGRHRASVVSDAMEALIGAIYLDGGLESASAFIHKYILKGIKDKQLFYDSKTILQEVVQSDYEGQELSYAVVKEEGPDHDKRFVVEARVGDEIIGTGKGRTKKAAEQNAAYNALMKKQA